MKKIKWSYAVVFIVLGFSLFYAGIKATEAKKLQKLYVQEKEVSKQLGIDLIQCKKLMIE